MSETTRLLVVGLDAMDPGLARRLGAEGRMPVLQGLIDESTWAPTRNPEGLVVGGIWPSYTTGCWPGRHGFTCFRQFVDGRYEIRRFDPRDIAPDPYWSSLATAGRQCCVIDAPLTTVAEVPGVVQLNEWGAHDRMLPIEAWPESFASELSADLGSHPLVGKCDHYAQRGDWEELRHVLADGAARKTELCLDLLGRQSWDLFHVVYGESHCAGHQFWGLHDPEWHGHDPAVAAELGDPLVDTYVMLDAEVGRLLAAVGSTTAVFVLLSHGIGPHHDGDHLFPEILERLDRAYGGRRLVRRVTEAGRRRLDRHTREAARRRRPDDRTLVGAVSVDGSRLCFPVPNNELYAAVRVNLRGREPRGLIDPGAEYDTFLRWLTDQLMALTDADSGRHLVASVHRVDDLFSGERRNWLPDLLVDWHRDRPITSAASAEIGEVRGGYSGIRTGDHRPSGMVIARGSGAGGPLAEPVDVVDLSATIAARLGVALDDVDGRPRRDLL